MNYNSCTAEQNAEYPGEALGLASVNTGWQLEQMVQLQNEFTAGPSALTALFPEESGERRDRRTSWSDCERDSCVDAEIKQ